MRIEEDLSNFVVASELPLRVRNALIGKHIHRIEDLRHTSRSELLSINGIGRKGLAKIECYLHQKAALPQEEPS